MLVVVIEVTVQLAPREVGNARRPSGTMPESTACAELWDGLTPTIA
ncbi:MAG: hypothetical protein PVH95_14845 [Anaerolineae bacterium]